MFLNKNDDKKENKISLPKESKPVISRTGKIGRIQVEEKRAENLSERPEEKSSDLLIADHEFHKENAGDKKKKKKNSVHTVKNKERSPFPVMTVLICVVCTALFMSMVVNFVQINEYTKDVADLQKSINVMKDRKSELSAELNKKNNLDDVKEVLNSMGMVDESKLKAPTPITPEKDDSVEDFAVTDEEESLVTVVLNALASNFSDTWNKFLGNE